MLLLGGAQAPCPVWGGGGEGGDWGVRGRAGGGGQEGGQGVPQGQEGGLGGGQEGQGGEQEGGVCAVGQVTEEGHEVDARKNSWPAGEGGGGAGKVGGAAD